jgi:type II secretory pathway component GspD/PulD (secretin)
VRTELGVTENLGIDWNVVGSMTGAKKPTTFPFVDNGEFSSPWNSVEHILNKYYANNDESAGTVANEGNAVEESSDFSPGAAFPNATADDYSFGTLDFSAFSATLNMLKSRSSTKIVSNPRIVTLNHKEALVQVGSEIGIPNFERNENSGSFEVSGYEPRNVGVVLSVTPHVNDANEILVDLKPEISAFNGFSAIGGTNLSYPSFTTTRAQTQVLIKNLETIAIGGLLADAESGTFNKVPVLGDIPMVGRMFKSKRQSAGSNIKLETLFFVTCRIIDTSGDPEEFTTPQPMTHEQTLVGDSDAVADESAVAGI